MDRNLPAAFPSWIMNHKTYASNAKDALGALQDISAKLDRLIALIAVNRPTPRRHDCSIGPRRRRLAS